MRLWFEWRDGAFRLRLMHPTPRRLEASPSEAAALRDEVKKLREQEIGLA